MIVNTASSCGYTYQYEGLQKLHDLYGEDVAVLGFPANDFYFKKEALIQISLIFVKKIMVLRFKCSQKLQLKVETKVLSILG